VRSDADTDKVEVADPFPATLTLAGLGEAVGLTGERDAAVSAGATEAARFTVPVKLYMLWRVMVTVRDEPGVRVALVGLGEILKSGGGLVMASVTSRVWVRPPLVPLMMTVQKLYTGADEDAWIVSVDVADPPEVIETLGGLSATLVVFAILAVTEAESVTVPLKRSRLLTVTIAVDDEPCWTLSLFGFIDKLKSGDALLESLQADKG
jgi:hypothetical protein